MTREEVLARIIAGRFLLIGEYRGGRAESRGFVDTRTGKASKYVVLTYIVECAINGELRQNHDPSSSPVGGCRSCLSRHRVTEGPCLRVRDRVTEKRARAGYGLACGLAWIARA
jgi:hypothetical protein